MLEVNLRAPIALARGLIPGMTRRRRGHLVFVSSLSGKAASPASSLYSATKFGLRGFALAVREDLHGTGVGASVVLPGFIRDAGMYADTGIKLPPGVGTRTPEQLAAAVIGAIERNRAEVTVAPPALRLGTAFAGLAPQAAAWFSRLGGSDRIAREFAERQLDKRP
jgi:short-subunit dehydrogenase